MKKGTQYAVISLVVVALMLTVAVSTTLADREYLIDETWSMDEGTYRDFKVYLEEEWNIVVLLTCEDYGVDPDMHITGPNGFYMSALDNALPKCTPSFASARIRFNVPKSGYYTINAHEAASVHTPGDVRLQVYRQFAGESDWNPFVMPETDTPNAVVPNADSLTPCGVFDVQGWGDKITTLADFPACSGPVTVMCLDGEGNWTDSTIHNLEQDGDVVTFTSGQDGTCGFFEQ